MTKTLLVDANNLLKIGFHGVKDYYHNGNHIGLDFGFVTESLILMITSIVTNNLN